MPLFENVSDLKFDSPDLLKLKKDVGEIVSDAEINDLISYGMIKDNLAYDLPHQRKGALKLLKDLNATALLADEVGLGKTITTGMV